MPAGRDGLNPALEVGQRVADAPLADAATGQVTQVCWSCLLTRSAQLLPAAVALVLSCLHGVVVAAPPVLAAVLLGAHLGCDAARGSGYLLADPVRVAGVAYPDEAWGEVGRGHEDRRVRC